MVQKICYLKRRFSSYERLRELLTHIDESECYGWDFADGCDCPPLYPAFASTLTLSTLRVSILSTFDLVDELLDLGFIRYVLTGNFNQDCIEVEYLRHFFEKYPKTTKLNSPSDSFMNAIQAKINEVLQDHSITIHNLGEYEQYNMYRLVGDVMSNMFTQDY
ncbi:hypothetical protein DAPPUDRAFT_114583 [Daphnia pulex]|uniref:Uncharacterized protein n=1 Tax=Daphnia pulex TaxID=6669 RepID=E9HIM7_DAPPU|nr:hypothetical protein DAPPUDRAFT_114583 [Daphnia pulex]|eukprot:EFX68414.1 hypothetical protein DAPPUDRAFT_114583 [Daphnia pulex]